MLRFEAQSDRSPDGTLNKTQIAEILTGIAETYRHWPEAPIYH